MKKTILTACALMVALTCGAEETDPMAVCDNHYASCTEKCDGQENVSADCYTACDNSYQKCLDVANGYAPEPEETPKPPKEAKKKKEKPALQQPDIENDDPDGAGHDQ